MHNVLIRRIISTAGVVVLIVVLILLLYQCYHLFLFLKPCRFPGNTFLTHHRICYLRVCIYRVKFVVCLLDPVTLCLEQDAVRGARGNYFAGRDDGCQLRFEFPSGNVCRVAPPNRNAS